jgi:glutamate synthase domain-containing protein 2
LPVSDIKEDAVDANFIVFGEGIDYPYTINSMVNISGMSFGALSAPAIQ